MLWLSGCGDGSSGGSTITSETNITAAGSVVENDTGSGLAGATIVFPDGEEVFCDAQGCFSMQISPGEITMCSVNAQDFKSTLVCLSLTSSRDDIEIGMVSSSSDDLPPIIYISNYDEDTSKKSTSTGDILQPETFQELAAVETLSDESTETYPLHAGWNQVSFHLDTITSIESTGNIANTLFHYNPSTSSYDFAFADNPSSLRNAYGYWLYAYEDTNITVNGVYPTQEQVSFEVKPGFNCFGLPYAIDPVWGGVQIVYQGSTYSVHDAIEQNWFGSTLFLYNPHSQSYDFYFANSNLPQRKGFWLYSEIECTLVFSSTMPDTGTVSGVITSTATTSPIEGIHVSIGDISDTTDSSGEYCLYDVPIGTQTIVLYGPGYDVFTNTVNVSGGGVTPKNLAITPVGAIYGIIGN